MKQFKWILTLFVAISSFVVGQEGDAKARVAIIGGGAAGLTSTWLLEQDYEVTLFEQQNRLGGHANTIQVEADGKTFPIDAGFEFFSDAMFPHFKNLLKILNVTTRKYSLTYTFFTADGEEVITLPPVHDGGIEWESFLPGDLFDLIQFGRFVDAGKKLVASEDISLTFEQFVEDYACLTGSFKKDFLYPFIAGAWGDTIEQTKKFVAYDILKYCVKNNPGSVVAMKWNEVVGGTSAYIQALAGQVTRAQIKLSSQIQSITYANGVYTITEEGGAISEFDHLVLATNALQARDLLKDIPETLDIRSILGQVEYFYTTIAVHGDPTFMPEDQDDWSVINIKYDGSESSMTVHKPWRSSIPIFRSWITQDVNKPGFTLPQPLYHVVNYYHPRVNRNYFEAQKAVEAIQGNRQLWFAGVYTYDVDSHESAILSAARLAQKLAPNSSRLKQLLTLEK